MTDGLDSVYGGSLALLTDLYQLTMAAGYWKAGHAEREAVFHLTFRRPPFAGARSRAGTTQTRRSRGPNAIRADAAPARASGRPRP